MYKTKQKENILNLLKNNNEKTLSAIEIIRLLNLKVSKATIYRQLDSLFRKNIINRYYNESTNRYEYSYSIDEKCSYHLHLKCNKCGMIYHLNDKITRSITSDLNFNIDFNNSLIYGICQKCK